MKATIHATTGSYNIEKAHEVADAMNANDDWTYTVIDHKNGLGRIDVYDEDGELVVKGFLHP